MRQLMLIILMLFNHSLFAQDFVEVTGHGLLQKQPDFVQLTLGVEGQNQNAATAARDNADMMARLVSFLQNRGVAKQDMQSQRLQLDASIDYKNNRITGYRAVRSMLVKVRDFDDFDQLLVDLADMGGNRMHHLNFGLDEPNQYQDQLLQLAVNDAQDKAQVLAQASARKLGQALQISEHTQIANDHQPMLMQRAAMEDSASVAPSLQTPLVNLNYKIKVRYQLD